LVSKAQRYEEHQRRVDEILTQAEANHRRNMWRRFISGTAGGAVGYALLGTLAYSAWHHVPWNWGEAGIRAGALVVFSSLFWACLMWWDRRTNPLRRR
jgi:hypothetical protein